jgi:uncharacterized protein (TIGR02246 family)
MISKSLPILLLVAGAASSATPEADIRAVLDRQAADWNRGSTGAFLEGYAPDAVFVSDTVSRGLDALRERYRLRYPTPAAMGHLTFSDVEIHMIDRDNAYVIGRWKLERSKESGGDVGGLYSLIFKKTPRGWKIALDHTS